MRAFARNLTSLVMCARCSWKFRVVLMCTPSILHDLLGERYLMCDPHRSLMEFIWFFSMSWFFCVRGLPKGQRAPVTSHLVVSS